MKLYKLAFSKEAPSIKDAVWAAPVEGGFALYLCDSGTWKPLKVMDDKGTVSTADDIVHDAVTSAVNTIKGKSNDDKTKLTLYGLKAYIDDAIANIE